MQRPSTAEAPLPQARAFSPEPPFAQVRVGRDDVWLLRDGGQVYSAMLEAIGQARRTICLETYILRDDLTGRRFAAALIERAQAGVEVSVMYDDWGSSVSDGFLSALHAAGVRTLAFRPVRFTGRIGRLVRRLKRRNHRKALIVDSAVAFTGGLNVSDHYAAERDGGHGWRDTAVRIEGPSAKELEALFLSTWRAANGAPIARERYGSVQSPAARPGDDVRIVCNDFHEKRKEVRREYLAAFARAKKRILLTHAYFVPPTRMLRALLKAARRGVEVVVMLGATTDVRLVYLASGGLYEKLLLAGVRVYEWNGRVLHAKTAVVDGRWATIGSSNLDSLSLRMNLEANAVIESEPFGGAMEAMFAQDLVHCREITLEAWRARPLLEKWLTWLAFQLRAWL